MKAQTLKPVYGNWVSKAMIRKLIMLLLLLGSLDTVLWIFVEGWLPAKILFACLAAFFLTCVIYLSFARRLFSENGADIQNKVLDVLMTHISWDGNGRALDIGCGSGALTVKLAKKYNNAKITGIDYWGGDWDYCQKQCEENATLERVADRVEFLQASATKIPFSDNSFDFVVSNLTFHEVKDSDSKLDALKEALRVLKEGSSFVFQDLFLIKSYYGTTDELIAAVKALGVKELHFVDTSRSPFIPKALKLPFMIGTLGLLYGKK